MPLTPQPDLQAVDASVAGWREMTAIAIMFTLGHAGLIAAPFSVAAMVGSMGLTTGQAGGFVTAELIAYAVAQLAVARYWTGLSPRRVALIGVTLAITGSLVSPFSHATLSLFASRAIAGAGFGLIFAMANLAGARSVAPERSFAVAMSTSTLVYVGLLATLGHAAQLVGWVGSSALASPFIVMAIFSAILGGFAFLLSDQAVPYAARILDKPRRRAGPPDALIVAIVLCFAVAVFGIYAFVERRAESIGMNTAAAGTMLSVTFGLSIFGSLAAAILGRRSGFRIPLVVGLTLQGLSCLGIALAPSEVSLWVATASNLALWAFLYGFMFGAAATIDLSGRLSVFLGAIYLGGSSLSSTVTGVLARHGSYEAIGLMSLLLCLSAASMAVVLTSARVFPRRGIAGNR